MSAGGWDGDSSAEALVDLLGLPRTASARDIKRAFRAEVKRLHPDHGPGAAAERDRFDRLIALYTAYSAAGSPAADEPDPWDEEWPAAGHPPGDSTGDEAPSSPADPETVGSSSTPPAPWFVPPPSGPAPRPGFWSP